MSEDQDQQLDQIIADYLQAQEDGQTIVESDFIAAHPEFADELRSFFDNLGQMDAMAGPLATPARSQAPELEKIRYFGDYELLEEIARGGMGVVYKANQTSLNRIVAVKLILSGHLAGDSEIKRFRAEAEAAANLKHSNIVTVYEVGQYNNQNYFSMDFIEGKNLSEIVRENPLPAKKAARYVHQIAEAIEYAHQQGTLHRDLKPSNVLIDRSDNVQITDFGLATRVEGDSELTRTGQILGTPSYMPPEQAQSHRDQIGPASDVYSIGAILYELLTGRPPFRAESALETLKQLIEAEAPPPQLLNAQVPQDLSTICMKCLQKEPKKRYATAAELAADLQRYLNDEPILARPVGKIERTWRWCRRNPTSAGLIAALAVSLIAGIIGTSWQAIAARQAEKSAVTALGEKEKALDAEEAERKKAVKARGEAETQRLKAVEERNEAQLNLYALRIMLAYSEWQRGNAEAAEKILAQTPEKYRGWEYHYVYRLCRSAIFDYETSKPDGQRPHGTPMHSLTYSPDGGLVAGIMQERVVEDGKNTLQNIIHIYDVATEELQRTIPTEAQELRFAPNGDLIGVWNTPPPPLMEFMLSLIKAPSGTAQIFCYDVQTGDTRYQVNLPSEVVDLAFSRSDENALRAKALSFDARILTLDVTSGEILNTTKIPLPDNTKVISNRIFGTSFGKNMALSAGRPMVALISERQGLLLIDLESGESRTILTIPQLLRARMPLGMPQTESYDLAFSPDGEMLALGTALPGMIRIFSTTDGNLLLQGELETSVLHSMRFSPDGSMLAAGGGDNRLVVWDIPSRQQKIQLVGHRGELGAVSAIAFSPDATQLASSGSHSLKIWNLLRSPEWQTFPRNGGVVHALAFSPDGKLLAAACDQALNENNVKVNIYDVVSGRFFNSDQSNKNDVFAVQFHPDGKRIATADTGGLVKIWDPKTGKVDHRLNLVTGENPSDKMAGKGRFHALRVAYSPDGKLLAATGARHKRVTLDPDGKRLPAADTSDKQGDSSVTTESVLVVWKLDGEVRPTFQTVLDGTIGALRFSSDGGSIVTVLEPLTKPDDKPAFTPPAFRQVQEKMSQDSDEPVKILTSPVQSEEKISVIVWKPATGQKLSERKFDSGRFSKVALSPDATLFAAASNRYGDVPAESDGASETSPTRVRVWETATGKLKHSLLPGVGYSDQVSLAFNPSGDRLVYNGGMRDRTIAILDLRNGRRVFSFQEPGMGVWAAAFSPDGQLLATGGMSDVVRVFDATDVSKETRTEHRQHLKSVAWVWHLQEAVNAVPEGRLQTALFHLNWLVNTDPDNPRYRSIRGQVLGELGRWKAAKADFEVFFRQPDAQRSIVHALQFAVAALKDGDHETYRRLCVPVALNMSQIPDDNLRNAAVWLCCLKDEALPQPIVLVEASRSLREKSRQRYDFANTYATALYRAGQFEEARQAFESAIQLHGKGGEPQDLLISAMAHARLGDLPEAEQQIEQAEKLIAERKELVKSGMSQRVSWVTRAEIALFLKEARETLDAARSSKRDNDEPPGDVPDP